MASKENRIRKRTSSRNGNLLTLGEVAQRAGVSIPTAQAYKRKYQDRLPSVGSGRTQRYKTSAVAVFKKLRAENAQNRGRKRGNQAASAPLPAKARPAQNGSLSLAEITRRTRISYPTLLRYLKIHGTRIPSIGSGRTRRFPAQAVAVFEELRGQSRGGRKPAADRRTGDGGTDAVLTQRVRRIEDLQASLSQSLAEILRLLKQPMRITVRAD